jgi:hypothetical protein
VARPVYSVRLIQWKGLTGTIQYTVPAGLTAVVRDLDSFIGQPTSIAALYFEGTAGQAIWFTNSLPGSSSSYASWRGRQVFAEGESFYLRADVGALDAYDVTVSGYLLTN